jgi:thiol:disulfide interchange protein
VVVFEVEDVTLHLNNRREIKKELPEILKNNKTIKNMLYILVLTGMVLLAVAVYLMKKGSYVSWILHIIASIIFVITGVLEIRQNEAVLGVFQFLAALGSIIGAIYAKSELHDY